MRASTALLLIILIQMCDVDSSSAQSSNFLGNWRVDVTFTNGQTHSVRFEARAGGKGSILLLAPAPNRIGPNEPSTAEWTQSDPQSVTFSGPMQFPLGNVGVLRGTLVFKGKFATDGSINGQASFFSVDQNPGDAKATPLKHGSFTAGRTSE